MSLQNQIGEVGGLIYKQQKAEVEALAQEVSEVDKIISKNQATLDNATEKFK